MLLGRYGMTNNYYGGIYSEKKVLVTGHTGFKGSWLTILLNELGAKVCGYALPPDTDPSMFSALNLANTIDESIFGDILDYKKLSDNLLKFQPDIVFHLAAQPLVRHSYKEPILTYNTNVMGTLNVLEAARKCGSVKAFINVTTDKCYENLEEENYFYKESDRLGGYDIYSSSKACSEILTSSYRRSFLSKAGFSLASARAGNVIGGGDWSEDRLIPDCVRAIVRGKNVLIRNPHAVRPWQHVLEPLHGYLLLGAKLLTGNRKYADCFNFGPKKNSCFSVIEIANMVVSGFEKGKVGVVDDKDKPHEASILLLDSQKAKDWLGFENSLSIEESVKCTVDWYRHFYFEECDMLSFTKKQVHSFLEQKFSE